MPRIRGYATPEGTRRFEARALESQAVAPGHFRESKQGLMLSSLGMGTYIGSADATDDPLMVQAAIRSVSSGAINVLDTAINYRYMRSERCVREALHQLLDQGIQREELFVCSKNGFITPDAEIQQDFRAYFINTFIHPGLIKMEDLAGGIHCMAPAYLEYQLDQSLENLGLETLDLLYLHNAAESQIPVIGHDAFMARLQAAFEFYERARAKNRIRYYGMATWSCFRVSPKQDSEYLNLDAVVKLAERVGGVDHGFRFIQLPFNLAFIEALVQHNQAVGGEMMSTLEAAMALEIEVFASVPLLQGQLLEQARLPQFPGMDTPAQNCLQFVRSQPGIMAPLVGHKQPGHVEENLKVAAVPPVPFETLQEILAQKVG